MKRKVECLYHRAVFLHAEGQYADALKDYREAQGATDADLLGAGEEAIACRNISFYMEEFLARMHARRGGRGRMGEYSKSFFS